MSGPLSDARARFTTATRLLKSLKVRLILTFGYFASNCFVSSWMTGIRPGSWLSYDHTLSVIGPSESKPSVCTAGAAAAVVPAPPEVSLAAGAAGVELLVLEPGVPPHAATTRPTAMAASAAVVPLRIRTSSSSVSPPADERRAEPVPVAPVVGPRQLDQPVACIVRRRLRHQHGVARGELEQRAHPLRCGKGLDGIRGPHGRASGAFEQLVQGGRREVHGERLGRPREREPRGVDRNRH